MSSNILQYESKIWATADLLRGSGIKESDWPACMMPFFALAMIESRLVRLIDKFKAEYGEEGFREMHPGDRIDIIHDVGQGYNAYIIEHGLLLRDICANDKTFEADFDVYLHSFDGETRELLGVDPGEGVKFLDMDGVVARLKGKRVLLAYAREWSAIDLRPFDNSEITTLEEHIKRRWADISAETAGDQYTPQDVIALIAELVAAKLGKPEHMIRIYDCTCGGGNLLFGVEDRLHEKGLPMTQTFGQDWNDALYALAKIESRFRTEAKIEYGNTLTDDKFFDLEAQVVVANPPYGVDWKGYQKDIANDKTQRFHYLPSVSDGQLLFTQHLIDKLAPSGMGVIVHNGSTLFSGDAGSAESNIRKWLLDRDLVEAIVQLPTDEFFNTGIHTYLWVVNKAKPPQRAGKLMLIDASQKFKPLKKSRGAKRREIDEASRAEIVAALVAFVDTDFACVFAREFFYYNKQAIRLTNVDIDGLSFADHLAEGQKSIKLSLTRLCMPGREISEFPITMYDAAAFGSLAAAYAEDIQPLIAGLDYKEQALVVETAHAAYRYDAEAATLLREADGVSRALGCGKIVVKSAYKAAGKKQPERIEITVELTPDYEKDYEIVPFYADTAQNQAAIAAFMAKYVTRPFEYLDNVVGVEINFNKVFYQPEQLRPLAVILQEIDQLDAELRALEVGLAL